MNALQRGNVDVIKNIMNKSKEVNKENNTGVDNINEKLDNQSIFTNNQSIIYRAKTVNYPPSGAYYSVKNQDFNESKVNKNKNSIPYNRDSYIEYLKNCIHMLDSNGEYSSAIMNLFYLYIMNDLDTDTVKSINYNDMKEIKSILREFMMELEK